MDFQLSPELTAYLAELDAFIDQANFPLADDWGRLLGGNILDSNWLVVTGEPRTVGLERALHPRFQVVAGR